MNGSRRALVLGLAAALAATPAQALLLGLFADPAGTGCNLVLPVGPATAYLLAIPRRHRCTPRFAPRPWTSKSTVIPARPVSREHSSAFTVPGRTRQAPRTNASPWCDDDALLGDREFSRPVRLHGPRRLADLGRESVDARENRLTQMDSRDEPPDARSGRERVRPWRLGGAGDPP